MGQRVTEQWSNPAAQQVFRCVCINQQVRLDEIKSLQSMIEKGLAQTAAYADQCAAEEAHLIVFDRRSGRSWEEKIFQRSEVFGSRTIGVWGM